MRDLDDPDSRADYRAFREAIVAILTTSRDIPFSRELVSASESEQVAVTLLEDQIARVHSESLEYNTQEYLDCLAHFSGREGQQLLRRALREGLPEYEVWEPIETALEYSTHNITARYLGQRTAGDLGPIPESDIDQYRSLLVESALRGDSEARTELVSIMRSSYQNSGVVNEPGAFWADPDLQTLEAVSARGHLRKLLGEDPEFTQELLVHAIENWQDPNSRALLLREVACSKYQGKESSPEETKIRAQQDFEAEIQRVIAEVSGGTHEFQTDPYQTPSKEEQQQRQHTLNIGEALRQLSQLQETSAVAASALQNGEIAQVAKEMWFPEIGRTSYDRLQERLSHLTELTIVAGRNLEGIKQVATLKYHMQRINPEAQVNVQWQTDSELVAADLFSKGKGCGIAFAGYSPEQTSSVDTIIRKAQSPSFEGKFLGVLDFREERESDTRLSNVWVEGLLHSGIDSANLLLSPGFNTHSDLIYGSDEIDSAWHFTREMSAAIEVDDIDSACNTAREQILAAGEARTKVQYREEIEGLSRIKLNPRGQLLFRLHDDPRTRLYEDTAKLDSLTDWLASGDRDAPAWIAAQVGYPAAYI
ncbi:MAG: hypothetical protein KDD70_03580 [Bdellovibrionales bacterium]|nr:hypothetical protein [Bdellovibrionales bacterium]